MTGADFIDLAGKLLAGSRIPSEALCRTVTSRAYYGAFHLARQFLAGVGIKTTDHGDAWKLLGGCGQEVAQRVASGLRTLHENRVTADYRLDLAIANDAAFARSNVERATDLMSLVAQCDQEPLRTAIQAGIENYRRKMRGER